MHKIIWLAIPLLVLVGVIFPKLELKIRQRQEQPIVLSEDQARLYLYEQLDYSYRDFKLMSKIAQAESQWSQYKDGEVLRGKLNPGDIGIYQISERFHLVNAQKMGVDIYTTKGNIDYAVYLYKKNGTRDWMWSYPIWSKL